MPMVYSNCLPQEVISTGKGSLDLVPVSLKQFEIQQAGSAADTVSCGTLSPPDTGFAPDGSASSITNLLEELLVIIFDDVITSELSSLKRRRHGSWPLSPPRNLASVSRVWRDIVFSYPMLWRYVDLTPRQSIDTLKEHLRNSSPVSIHLTVHQWPFRHPIASGPYSIIALTAQLQSILSPIDKEGDKCPTCQRVESITINATASTFLNFVLQTWTGRGSKFPALRSIAMNGNVCATWSRTCFFDGQNAPALERLELCNVVIAFKTLSPPWGIGLNLTTLVWAAPVHKRGSLIVSVSCFHHVISSFPNMTHLELLGHVVGFEFASLASLEESGVTPLTHIRDLRISGQVFSNAGSAFILFYLVPSLRHLAVRGRAYSGPVGSFTVTAALQAIICLPMEFGWPMVMSELETFDLECVDESECDAWHTWCMGELERWREWRETLVNASKGSSVARVRMQLVMDQTVMNEDEGEHDILYETMI